jgi:hypothetical protein
VHVASAIYLAQLNTGPSLARASVRRHERVMMERRWQS